MALSAGWCMVGAALEGPTEVAGVGSAGAQGKHGAGAQCLVG